MGFARARILYCRRNALDNCVSIFRMPFDENQSYSHDLAALGHFYRQHERLMSLWFDCYPGRILSVAYEQTVAELEHQARHMLGFIGIEFEAGVLRYFDNTRVVLTPSAQQVRQPIYSTSVDVWKRYGCELRPLIDALS